ncbi:MAG: nitroreductase [Sphingomonadaceae bacterium]
MTLGVTEAVTGRRSVRAYLDRPVGKDVLERVLEKAQCAPSGGNLQPWHCIVLTGAPLERLKAHIARSLPEGKAGWTPEYDVYPASLEAPYADRRFDVGERMYESLNIARDDRDGRRKQFAHNYEAFGAPVLLLVHFPRYMGPPQWSDTGMWLQTLMLLLREEGLESCAQEAWSMYQRQIREIVPMPDDHIFFCGVAIGYADPDNPVNRFPLGRAPMDEWARFDGF